MDAKKSAAAVQAIQAGLRATRRQNLIIACSVCGSQVALAGRLAEFTGTTRESKEEEISRIVADRRSMSEAFALMLELVMGWEPYSATTVWRERRKVPRAVPRTWHDLDRKVEPLG